MDLSSILNNFINKASNTTVNSIIWILGAILIISVIILSFFTIKKIIVSFHKEEKYINLLETYHELESNCNVINRNYEKTASILESVSQLNLAINSLLTDFYSNTNFDEIKIQAIEMIKSIVYTIPQNYKVNFCDFHRCFIWMKSDENEHILENCYSSIEQFIDDLHISDSFAGRIYTTGLPRYSPNINEEKDFEKRTVKSKYKSLIGVPIKQGEDTIGVLTIDAKQENAFNENDDFSSLTLFASLISTCLLIVTTVALKER